MRGVCAVLPLDSKNSNPWDVWDAVARARMHAVDTSHKDSPIFVGQSCLRLMGIRGWSQNPPVTIYRENRRCTSSLPSCHVSSTTVPATSVSCSGFPPLSEERSRIDGLVVEHPYDALVRCALHDEPLESFVLGCMALNVWSQFSMFHQDECRRRAEEIRAELLARLDRAGHVRGYRRAHAVLKTIDPGCANPAEAALLWLVRSTCPFTVKTQVHIGVSGRHYYIDILIEDLHLIIEFDGGSETWGKSRRVRTSQARVGVARSEPSRCRVAGHPSELARLRRLGTATDQVEPSPRSNQSCSRLSFPVETTDTTLRWAVATLLLTNTTHERQSRGKVTDIRIGYEHRDSLITYPDAPFLSRTTAGGLAPPIDGLLTPPRSLGIGPAHGRSIRMHRTRSRSATYEPTAHRFPTPRGRKPSGAQPHTSRVPRTTAPGTHPPRA